MFFVTELNSETRTTLRRIARHDSAPKRGERAHAVLLSDQGYKIDTIAEIFDRDRDTVSVWLNNWENHAFDGLDDAPRSGRPPSTSAAEDRTIVRAVQRHPQQIRQAQAAVKKRD